jgi:hypothetical protein
MRSFRLLGVAAICATLFGCVGDSLGSVVARRDAISAAASDHACDKGRISVTKEEMSTWTYELLVCGQARTYRDTGGKRGWHFVEVGGDAGTGADAEAPPQR